MKASQQAIDLIKRFEGCSLIAYPDIGGVFTIGYGHTGDVMPYDQIHQEQADKYLAGDVASAERGVSALVTAELTQNQFDALVSFVFNIGVPVFALSTMLKLTNQGDYVGAAEEFKLWNHAGGKEVAGLTARRLAERDLFLRVDMAQSGS